MMIIGHSQAGKRR